MENNTQKTTQTGKTGGSKALVSGRTAGGAREGDRSFIPRRGSSQRGGPAGGQKGGGNRPPFRGGARKGGPGGAEGRSRRGSGGPRRERVRPEFEQRVVNIRRVTRVVAGGRRFNFSVVMILGDRKGTVGVGIGKAGDTALAIEKATKDAKKNMIKVPLTKNMSIPHQVRAKYSSSLVEISPAPGGGLVAGSSVRNVLELAGVTDVMSKIHSRSRNRLNNARVAIKALKQLKRAVAVALPAAAVDPTVGEDVVAQPAFE
ncbi:MAG: 30S ribosomal protein S5 [Parcubacteria group bacterium Greene0416_14]|nr:MAG: 30S ribosomal protein S5 [Parcubacteria group bacterium Greene0416_14]TSD00581.1 MAG: 30S ribosomal protein S5 [Parcubacteria group bacterium Greene1014_15]TSD08272.1 MAG: 30S ribosomal protein S5 [Parcubacteria group bacterium Greene0714_4]